MAICALAGMTSVVATGRSDYKLDLLNLGSGNEDSSELLKVYMSGEIAYCLENNLKENDAQSFVYAMSGVIDAYSKMKNHDSEQLNKYLNLDEEQRKQQLLEYYKKMTAAK